jgi:glycosyl transferase family 87
MRLWASRAWLSRVSRVCRWPSFLIVLAAMVVDFGNRPQPAGIDFHTYLAAARLGASSGWSHIYDQGLVAAQQAILAPAEHVQPYLSPPPVAWLASALIALPFSSAYAIWAIVSISALAAAVAWSAPGGAQARAFAALLVTAPLWVLQAGYLGQVVLLVAAAIVVAWRLLRDHHEVAAGLVLALVLLKPNTAFVVPLVLAVSGRYRILVAFSLAAAAVAGAALLTVGTHALDTYFSQLLQPPPGTNAVSMEAALGVSGPPALALRLAVLGVVLASAWKSRTSPGHVMALGVLASLLVTPYLHVCDLCLLAAAGWIVWEERPTLMWRVPLAASWVIASPFVDISGLGPTQNRWPLLELLWLAALLATAHWSGRKKDAAERRPYELSSWRARSATGLSTNSPSAVLVAAPRDASNAASTRFAHASSSGVGAKTAWMIGT